MAKLARSTFFYHQQPKLDKDSELKARIREIKQKEPNYGYRRVTAKLGDVNHKRVQRLIQEMGLQVRSKKQRKYSSYKGEQGKIAPNLLQRNFSATKPNEKWLTDITEFKVKEEKLYFSPILDCFNNELIAYQSSRSPNGMLVQKMLLQAVEKLPKNTNLILHSDQGFHYQMHSYQSLLAKNGIQQSMSRKGNCLDNAAMESFFGRMKT
ncbi:transposase, partial [Pasteurellaceae bacterium LFhippo2]|nr:transposase [Pasteurellaceae bacterium LFhippo2]